MNDNNNTSDNNGLLNWFCCYLKKYKCVSVNVNGGCVIMFGFSFGDETYCEVKCFCSNCSMYVAKV